jgi:hypothetical protein
VVVVPEAVVVVVLLDGLVVVVVLLEGLVVVVVPDLIVVVVTVVVVVWDLMKAVTRSAPGGFGTEAPLATKASMNISPFALKFVNGEGAAEYEVAEVGVAQMFTWSLPGLVPHLRPSA